MESPAGLPGCRMCFKVGEGRVHEVADVSV